MKKYPLYQHVPVATTRELLAFCVNTHADKTAFQYSLKKEIRSISFCEFYRDVVGLNVFFHDQGLTDCHIAVLGENSYEWILTHFAVTCGKNVIVPIDKDLTASDIQILLKDSESKALVYSASYSDLAEEIKANLPGIITLSMNRLHEILDSADYSHAEQVYSSVTVDTQDLASIVYTSGTTGKSKGVMLTHQNLMTDLYAASCNARIDGTSILLLPLHHTFGLVAGLYSVMYYGHPLYINKSLKRIASDLQLAKPQNTFVVPLVVETLYKNVWINVRKKGKEKALKLLIRVSNILRRLGIDVRRKLFREVLSAFGGELEVIICGGAPLNPKLVSGMEDFGITVMNGYGITECSPIVAVNRNKYNIIGSVGLPLCCNEVKISEEGEILVRGTNVMAGYYKNDAENKKAFIDGWFRTGDLGRIDRYGALHITGRIKNLIILSNGENVAAEEIEAMIEQCPWVKEVIAYGENDRIVAEIYPDPEVSDSRERIQEDIKRINGQLPQHKNIGQVKFRNSEFPKTTTKKIKRNFRSE